jgi:hypothetical protein
MIMTPAWPKIMEGYPHVLPLLSGIEIDKKVARAGRYA